MQMVVKNGGTFSLNAGESVLSVLKKRNLATFSNCGGHGTCGKCAVRFLKGAPLPLPADRKRFSPSQLREGYRLACLAKPAQDCIVEMAFEKEKEFILTSSALPSDALSSQMKSQVLLREGPEQYGDTFVIADLGTTTIVLQLVEAESGRVIDTYRALNPQRQYGSDVVSRMEHALAGMDHLLADCVHYLLEGAVEKWLQAGFSPLFVVLAGNTVMDHLLLHMDVSGLSHAPFTPVTTEQVVTDIAMLKCYVMPGISAFVGGDIMAGMLSVREQMRKEKVEKAFLIDLGTNGEMALIDKDRTVCTATAAGPAFEGGASANVPGTDMIALVARMLSGGIIDETGLICEEYFHNGVTVDHVCIRQEDVRGLQIAKAAVYAGIHVLLETAGCRIEELERVYLAGGFGYLLDGESAIRIGLLPVQLRGKITAVGNTALSGAYEYGRLLMNGRAEQETAMIKKQTESINLAEQDAFQTCYLQAMSLTEMAE